MVQVLEARILSTWEIRRMGMAAVKIFEIMVRVIMLQVSEPIVRLIKSYVWNLYLECHLMAFYLKILIYSDR